MKKSCLLLDADDTLFDFAACEHAALLLAMEKLGLRLTEEQAAFYALCNEREWQKLEKGLTTQTKLRTDRFAHFLSGIGSALSAQVCNETYTQELAKQAILFDDALPFLRVVRFDTDGCRRGIYIVTNGIAQVQHARMEKSPIAAYVDGVLVSEEVGAAKPDPALLFAALQKAGAEKEEALLIGDRLQSDILSANRAGIDSILLNRSGKPMPTEGPLPICTVKSLMEIPALFL